MDSKISLFAPGRSVMICDFLPTCFDIRDSSSQNHGINFINNLSYTEELNPYTYRNFYNGGGVGIGDINNDSLPVIFKFSYSYRRSS